MILQILAAHLIVFLLGIPCYALLQGYTVSSIWRIPQRLAFCYLLGEWVLVLSFLVPALFGVPFSLYVPFGVALTLWLVTYLQTHLRQVAIVVPNPQLYRWWIVSAVLLLLCLVHIPLSFFHPLVAWDARSIWFFHGKAFFYDGGIFPEYLNNPAYLWSHPDYPPAVPILAAFHAMFVGHWDEVLCKSFLWVHWFFSLLAIAGLLGRRGVPALVIAGFIIFLDLLLSENILHGYADSFMVVLLLLGLLQDSPSLRLALLCFAALVKAEALVFISVFYGCYLLQRRFTATAICEALACAFLASPWQVFTRLHQIRGEYFWSLDSILRLSLEQAIRRFEIVYRFAASAIPERFGYSSVALFGITLLFALIVSIRYRHRDTFLLALVFLGSTLVIPIIYITAPVPIPWLLETSLLRLWYFPLCFAAALLCLVLAVLQQQGQESWRSH